MGTTIERHAHLHVDDGVHKLWTDHHSLNIEYAKYVGFLLILIGLAGIPFAGETFIFFTLTQLQCTGHIITGMCLLASVIFFDGSYASLMNQIIGPFCIIMGVYGLSGVTPVTVFFNLNIAEIIFYILFGVITAVIGWKQELSSD